MDELVQQLAPRIALLALVVVAILTVLKQVLAVWLGSKALDSKLAQVLLPVAPLVLGGGLALVPEFFIGYSVGARAMIGIVAGFMSPTIYNLVKRRFPGLLASKGMAGRQASNPDKAPVVPDDGPAA